MHIIFTKGTEKLMSKEKKDLKTFLCSRNLTYQFFIYKMSTITTVHQLSLYLLIHMHLVFLGLYAFLCLFYVLFRFFESIIRFNLAFTILQTTDELHFHSCKVESMKSSHLKLRSKTLWGKGCYLKGNFC